jgi:hypothetical protein
MHTDYGFTDSELAVVLWMNPEIREHPQRRLLETVTSRHGNQPIAFPLSYLQKLMPDCEIAEEEDLHILIFSSTQENPVFVPLPIARSALGWNDFYVSPTYVEPK